MVEHCLAFKDCLDDKSGSMKYYPDDPSLNACMRYFRAHEDKDKSARREVFEKILSQKSPVFRFFFVEKFGHSHQAWHASKLRYTRSVAVNSMVGHILGIGKSILHRDDVQFSSLLTPLTSASQGIDT